MVFEEKYHMPWAYEAYEIYEAYEAYELDFRENVVNGFHRRKLLPPPALTPSTACGRSPSLEEGGLGARRSRPPALPSIGYRGFAVAPMTLRAPSRSPLYNSGCRVATLLVSKGVMGFLGDLRGRNRNLPLIP